MSTIQLLTSMVSATNTLAEDYPAEQQKNLSLMKDQFISNVNHKMRNPLIGAIGALDLLKDKSVDLTEQEREQFLDQAICACDELQRIAGNILDAIRVDSDVSPPWIKEFDHL